MKIVHTMIRVNDLDESLKFYCDGLGMKLLKRRDYESGRFTNVFVGYGAEETDAVIELTYNWDTHKYDLGNGFGRDTRRGDHPSQRFRLVVIGMNACRSLQKRLANFRVIQHRVERHRFQHF